MSRSATFLSLSMGASSSAGLKTRLREKTGIVQTDDILLTISASIPPSIAMVCRADS